MSDNVENNTPSQYKWEEKCKTTHILVFFVMWMFCCSLMLLLLMGPTGKQEKLTTITLPLSHTRIQFQTSSTGGFEQKHADRHILQKYIIAHKHLHT